MGIKTAHKIITAAFFIFMFLFATVVFAAPGAVSSEQIERMRSAYKMDSHMKAMRNAVANNPIDKIALNQSVLQHHNEIFSHKIDTKGITNQEKSGRCWLFAGLNVFRPLVIEKYNLEEFEFSEIYLTFYDKLEKANCFLERIIEFRDRDPLDREMAMILSKPIPDGGYWESVVNLIRKYGLVPREAMAETHSSQNTALMNKLISRKLRTDAIKLREMSERGDSLEQLRSEKQKMLTEVHRMLVMNLGRPPEEFQWRFEDTNSVVSEMKTCTPRSFFEEFVDVNLDDYVDIFNDPTKDYGEHYELTLSRNVYDGDNVSYANIEMKTLKEIAVKSILDDEPVWFACDVCRNQSKEHGLMASQLYDYDSVYRIDTTMTKTNRPLYRESRPNHAMVFTGVDILDEKPVKWLVENSWGDKRGNEGYWTLYDRWFENNVYSIIVKKQYVPEEVLRIFEKPKKPVPPWDPMFDMVR